MMALKLAMILTLFAASLVQGSDSIPRTNGNDVEEFNSWIAKEFKGQQATFSELEAKLSDYCAANKYVPKDDGGMALSLIRKVLNLKVDPPSNCNSSSSDKIKKLIWYMGFDIKEQVEVEKLTDLSRFAYLKREEYAKACATFHNEELAKSKYATLGRDIWQPVDTMTETFSKIKGNILEKSDPFDKQVERKLLKFGTVIDLLAGQSGRAIHKGMIAHRGKNNIEEMGYPEGVRYLRNGCELYMYVLGDKLREIEKDWLPNVNYPYEVCTKNGKENCEVPKTWGSFVLCKRLLAYSDNKINSLFLGTMAGLKRKKGASE